MSGQERNQLRGSPELPTRFNQANSLMDTLRTSGDIDDMTKSRTDSMSPLSPSRINAAAPWSHRYEKAQHEFWENGSARRPPSPVIPEAPTGGHSSKRCKRVDELLESGQSPIAAKSESSIDSLENSNAKLSVENQKMERRLNELKRELTEYRNHTRHDKLIQEHRDQLDKYKSYAIQRNIIIDQMCHSNTMSDRKQFQKSQEDHAEVARLRKENQQLIMDKRNLTAKNLELEEKCRQKSEASRHQCPALADAQTQTTEDMTASDRLPSSPRLLRKRIHTNGKVSKDGEDDDISTSPKWARNISMKLH